MLEETLECPAGHFSLQRPGSNDKSLRAWDAADEYLISHITENLTNSPLAIFNDQFGTLGCALNEQIQFWASDSYCATQALNLNLSHNQSSSTVETHNALAAPVCSAEKPLTAVIKLPKNLSFFEHQLQLCFKNGIQQVLIAGMMKHLPKNILSLLQQYGQVNRLPFKKKATIFQLELSQSKESQYPKLNQFEGITLSSEANVFGRDKLDPGAQFFLQNIKQLPKAEYVADLCCGSGILGLKYTEIFKPSSMHFYDESQMAVHSCENSWKLNQEDESTQGQFFWNDGIPDNNSTRYDLILCNPPFHEQHTVGDHIAKRLFKDAKNNLGKGGQLIVVGNRHLGYHQTLKAYFKHVKLMANNQKFVIISAYD